MTDQNPSSDSSDDSSNDQQNRDNIPPISSNAVIIEGTAHNGKACRLIDNTASIDQQELKQILEGLITNKEFGLKAFSSSGNDAIKLNQARFTHIQIGEDLYRLILLNYEARIENF